jgi:CheY-like chemotaxis protein
MLVDDDPVVLEVVKALLSSRGYVVTTRSRAMGTTAALLQDPQDVVVLDVEMPGLTGDALLRALQKNAKLGFRMPRMVIHSAQPPARVAEIVRESGALGAIPKGDARDFVVAFEALLGKATRLAR